MSLPSPVDHGAPPRPLAPLRSFEVTIDLEPDDMYGPHINNARYFAFINSAFQGWYAAIEVEKYLYPGVPMMAHLAYDFVREMTYPGTVTCRLTAAKLGRSSLEHAIEMFDAGSGALVGRGRCVHVWFNRDTGKGAPWPNGLLERFWAG